jgi:hypothetical protein
MLTRVSQTGGIDYSQLAATNRPSLETWDTFVRDALVERWLVLYEQVSDWSMQVLEIPQGDLTFLFDGRRWRRSKWRRSESFVHRLKIQPYTATHDYPLQPGCHAAAQRRKEQKMPLCRRFVS